MISAILNTPAIQVESIEAELNALGCAIVSNVLSAEDCSALSKMYGNDDLFRSRVVMARHGFGRGEYKYFGYPLPPIVAFLRRKLYPALADIANRWNDAL